MKIMKPPAIPVQATFTGSTSSRSLRLIKHGWEAPNLIHQHWSGKNIKHHQTNEWIVHGQLWFWKYVIFPWENPWIFHIYVPAADQHPLWSGPDRHHRPHTSSRRGVMVQWVDSRDVWPKFAMGFSQQKRDLFGNWFPSTHPNWMSCTCSAQLDLTQ